MPKVLIVQNIHEDGIKLLSAENFEVRQLDCIENLSREIADAEALLVRDAKIPRTIIEKGRLLKVISRHGAGLENIDIPAATERKIWVTYTPIANSASVAEHVMGMILVLAKNLVSMDRLLREGDFDIRHRLYGTEIEGKTISIIGLGNVGRRVAKKAAYGFGMKVIGYDPYAEPSAMDPVVEITGDWERLFREGDFISLHMSLNEATRDVIGGNEFRLMKKSAYIINCARAAVVKEVELLEALREGRIAGAGIDVYDPSPPAKDHPLFKMPNVIVTPHSAAHTNQAMRNMSTQAAMGIVEVLRGKRPTWPANRIS